MPLPCGFGSSGYSELEPMFAVLTFGDDKAYFVKPS
jgi:hypothetical protein